MGWAKCPAMWRRYWLHAWRFVCVGIALWRGCSKRLGREWPIVPRLPQTERGRPQIGLSNCPAGKIAIESTDDSNFRSIGMARQWMLPVPTVHFFTDHLCWKLQCQRVSVLLVEEPRYLNEQDEV